VSSQEGKSPGQGGGASPSGKATGKGFKSPRRTGETVEGGSALAERGEKAKARLSAEALEANAEKQAEQEAKRARQSNTTGTTGKGKKASKAKGQVSKGNVDLTDFPEGEQ
jgi:hypothetical protein